MLSVTLAVLVLAVTPASAIKGGTLQQQTKLKSILDKLPDCITAPGGVPVAVVIVSGTGPQATFVAQDGTLRIDESLLDPTNFPTSSLAYRQDMCATQTEVNWLVNDTRRVVVHELAHAYRASGKTGRTAGRQEESVLERLDGFLKLRFDAEFEIWTNDPMRLEYETELTAKLEEAQKLRKSRRQIPSKLLREICDLHSRLCELYDPTGLPARFRNDRHAAKQPEMNDAMESRERPGSEFFAIAVETLVGDHGRFCKQFTADEQTWLAEELGDCLGGLPGKSPCYPDPNRNRTTPGASPGVGVTR